MFRRLFSSSLLKHVAINNHRNSSIIDRKNSDLFLKSTHYHSKRFKMTETGGQCVIGTHSGCFHCDEILACYMLQTLPKYQNAKIVRTRDEAVIKTCDIVVDVGSVFDPAKSRFDHHQKTFQHTLGSLRPEFAEKFSKVRLSSAGLIYTFFGEQVICEVVKKHKQLEISDECVRQVFEKVYEYFIQEIDGIDNGVQQHSDEPLYRITTCLSSRIGNYNSQWNSAEDFDEQAQFEKAKKLAGEEFVDKVLYYSTVWWPARSIVEKAIEKRHELHESGKIIELEKMCPWKQHFYDLEKQKKCENQVLYCVAAASPTDYRVICVPNTANSFICRKFLPPSWRGIRDEHLAEVAGVSDATFCHVVSYLNL